MPQRVGHSVLTLLSGQLQNLHVHFGSIWVCRGFGFLLVGFRIFERELLANGRSRALPTGSLSGVTVDGVTG
jgi:hypothetical protein